MKVGVLLSLVWISIWNACVTKPPTKEATIASTALLPQTENVDSMAKIDFTKDIQPILQTRCSPCHFTGGKMYERMPFDKAETILGHSEGVLRRIKENPDAQKLKDFVKQHSK